MFCPFDFRCFFRLNLGFSPKADMVIEFAEFGQGFEVFQGFGNSKALGRALSQINKEM
jgi:hypothetical protein